MAGKCSKRKLNFQDKAFHGKQFYIDIKAETVKRKVIRRIKELGGNIEGFLSKDINLFITDKKNGDFEKTNNVVKEKPTLPTNLSRGRALLLKSNAQSENSRRSSIGGNDIVQNAINLGVEVSQANTFLKSSAKLIQDVKKSKTNEIDGVSPIEWTESEKENIIFLKVEDTDQLYKPLYKHFESFPGLYYNDEVASPFVKGVVLTKQTEKTVNRYSTAKKQAPSNNGGFCEACDYWYRCSLREHIKSARHEKFVKDQTNFNNLDSVIKKLPSITDFFSKLGKPLVLELKSNEMMNMNGCEDEIVKNHQSPEDIENNADSAVNIEDLEQEDYGMPTLVKELPSVALDIVDQENGSSIGEEQVSLLSVASYPQINTTMPILHEIKDESNTRDSGTGPELQDLDSCEGVDSNFKAVIKRTNSDSALPPGDEESMCCSPYPDNDNAVFMEDIYKSTNQLVQNVTTNVRKKFSRISISETDDKGHNIFSGMENIVDENCKVMSKDNLVETKIEKSFCFSEISSPAYKSNEHFDFKNLATTWMKEIKQSESCGSKDTDTYKDDTTEDLNPEDYKDLFKHHGFSGCSSSVSSNTWQWSSENVMEEKRFPSLNSAFGSSNSAKNSPSLATIDSTPMKNVGYYENSRDSVSLISMPDTPKTNDRYNDMMGISEDSVGYTPNDTLCASDSNASFCSVYMASEKKMLDFGSSNSFSNSKQEPIKLKINLSDIKKNEKKKKRRAKVKRRIFPDGMNSDYSNMSNDSIYQTEQKGEMKIKLCKVAKTPVQKNGDLMSYWKVRKSGGCRLVFSAEKINAGNIDSDTHDRNSKKRANSTSSEKRKAEDIDDESVGKLRKRRKCIYLQFF